MGTEGDVAATRGATFEVSRDGVTLSRESAKDHARAIHPLNAAPAAALLPIPTPPQIPRP